MGVSVSKYEPISEQEWTETALFRSVGHGDDEIDRVAPDCTAIVREAARRIDELFATGQYSFESCAEMVIDTEVSSLKRTLRAGFGLS